MVYFSPSAALNRTAEIVAEQYQMLAGAISGVLPDVAFDPVKVVEDAMLQLTDKKDLLVAYVSTMIVGEQGTSFNSCVLTDIQVLMPLVLLRHQISFNTIIVTKDDFSFFVFVFF